MTRPRPVRLILAALAFNLLLFVPGFLFAAPRPGLLRVSLEYVLGLTALALAAPTRLRAPVRALVVALYAGLLLFITYHHAYHHFFLRPPAVVEDWRLLLNLLHLVGEMTSPRWLAFVVACAASAIGLVVALARVFAALERRLAAAPRRVVVRGAVAGLAAGVVSTFLSGPVSRPIADNYRASRAAREKLRALRDAPPDRRNVPLLDVRLARRPSFYLLMIEAYGEQLATWDMTDAYRALTSRVEARLAQKGFSAATAYSTAPVHGGKSWLSIATVHTGIMIDQPGSFAALELVGARLPTLTRFFRLQGHETVSLQPGTVDRSGLGRLDLYNHHRLFDAAAIGYRGPRRGFFAIPDQYSLAVLRERYLDHAPEPRYLFFMAVSTHFPWRDDDIPPYVRDPRTLDGPATPPLADDPSWPPIPGVDRIGTDYRRGYFRSIEYEWRVLTDFLEADPAEDLVVVVLGDHQPRLESNPPGEVTFNAPLHVLSRDPALIERFVAAGFQRGLFAEPGRGPALKHEGLFSLFVSKLSEAYGTPETRRFARYYPDGISLAGLNE